jgi:hypothetical protein
MENHNTFMRKEALRGTARHEMWGTVELLSKWENARGDRVIRVRLSTVGVNTEQSTGAIARPTSL